MEVVEIREGNVDIEGEEEEDQTDDSEYSEGHLVLVGGRGLETTQVGRGWAGLDWTDLVRAGTVGLLVTLEDDHLQPGGDHLGTVQ